MARVDRVPVGAASRRPVSLWTVAATVAGLIGAAAAVYPLIHTDQQLVHLTLNNDLLRVEALSEPVILTGNWHVRRLRRWWWNEVVSEGLDDRVMDIRSLKDRRVGAPASERTLVGTVREWSDVERCEGSTPGEFEFGVEFNSKSGLAWAHIRLPFCAITPEKRAAWAKAAKGFWEAEAARVRAEEEAIKARAEARAATEVAKARAEEEAKSRAKGEARAARIRADAQAAEARGDALAAKGDYLGAVSEYTNAIKIDGSDFAAFSKRGDAYIALKLVALAIEDFRVSLRLRCSAAEKTSFQPAPCGESRWGVEPIDITPSRDGE